MKIGILVPTQGKRPNFLKQCIKYIDSQTYQPDIVEIVGDKSGLEYDLTWRFRLGLERIKNKCDLVFIFEDDDYYSPDYIQVYLQKYRTFGSPSLIGRDETTYYHLANNKYHTFNHPRRASMFSTVIHHRIIPHIIYPSDDFIAFDMHLWQQFNTTAQAFHLPYNINLGIKHGLGITGGIGHKSDHRIYTNEDTNWSYLTKIVGEENASIYRHIIEIGEP